MKLEDKVDRILCHAFPKATLKIKHFTVSVRTKRVSTLFGRNDF